MILDVNVPFVNGFTLLKELREANDNTPAIFITALTDISSIEKGFDVGADDYIKKPFNFDELLIRINALLKKSFQSYKNIIKFDKFSFDIEKNELFEGDIFVKLTPIDLNLLKIFIQNKNHTISKDSIIDYTDMQSDGALRVHINSLRKLGIKITTIKGIGYKLES